MALLNEKGFERKLQQMSQAQDSVQTVSLWIIHHKKYADEIVKVWTENLKRCNPDRRLVLFYLANDVLQNSRKKGKEFSTAFSKVLKDVIHLLSERKICDSVQRVMKIWQERKVFEKDFLDSLQHKFETSQGKVVKVKKLKATHVDSDNERGTPKQEIKHTATPIQEKKEKKIPPPDFKASQMIDALKAMRDLQAEVSLKESQLNSLRVDASDMEAIKQLKDRSTGAKFTADYESASEKLESFCDTLKFQKEETSKLIECLEDGVLFYDAAFGEVRVIVHAYKTFGNRLNSLKKKVDHKMAKIINAAAEKKKMGPIHTPRASFLTSGLPDISSATSTPSQNFDDKNSEAVDPTVDNTEVADMDIEDDDDSENDESQSPSDSTSTPSSDVKMAEASGSAAGATSTVTTTTAASSSSALSGVSTSFTSSTSTMPVQMALPPQMMMQQPHMQFIPGQPGMSMIPVGMPGSGHFISMPSQFHQPMVPYGMGMHGIGTFPGQPQMSTIPLPGQAQFPGMVTNLPHQIPGSIPQMAMSSNTLTPVISQSPLPGQSIQTSNQVAPLAQPASISGTSSTQSNSKPQRFTTPTGMDSSSMDESVGSPSSEISAPSPVGSPELALGGDETPETASPKRLDDVKIIGFPTVPGQSDQGDLPGTSEEASATSTGSASPSRSSDLSKPVSAVNILAQLISRGRQLKEQTSDAESTSGASTPKEEPVPTTQPQQEKPLFTLIDSLFPKLSDSLKTIRQREKDNETSTSTSEEGSPKQKIEINSMGDNDDSENESEHAMQIQSHGQGRGHMGPMGFHPPDFTHGNPRGPFVGHPPDGSIRQPWNNDHFPNHVRPHFGDYQERPQIPIQSPVEGPSHGPRFPGPQRDFQGPQGAFYGQPEIDPEGPRDDYRGIPQRSPRQLHSPRAAFNRPDHELDLNNGPPNEQQQRGPRGPFVVGPQNHGPQERSPRFAGMQREEQRPQFRFENPGSHSRPVGPPDVHRVTPGGSPQRPRFDGRPKPRWLGPEGPRGNHPRHDGPRGPNPHHEGPLAREGPQAPIIHHEGRQGPHPHHEGPHPHHEGPHPHHEGPRPHHDGPHPHHEGPHPHHEGPHPHHEGPHPHHEGPRSHHDGPHHEGPHQHNEGPHPHHEGPRPHHDGPHHEGPRGPLPHREGPRGPHHEGPRGNIPHHEGPHGNIPHHEGPHGNIPHHEGPRGNIPQLEGPRGNIPHHEGPRGNIPHLEGPHGNNPHHDEPRGFQRSFSDSDVGDMSGEPPMKRQVLEEGPPQGRQRAGFPPSSPGFDRNREMWREREQWETHRDPHLVQDRTRPEFHDREGHLSPRFVDHGNRPFPPHERPPFPPRRDSFKGFEHREHFTEHRTRPRFPGGHQRPFY